MSQDETSPQRQYWDHQAASFDQEPDHGLRDPAVRAAWKALLQAHLPAPGRVLDAGCGTGSLSLLLAELGNEVVGMDFSPAMIAAAQAKAAQQLQPILFQVMDASAPAFPPRSFHTIAARHILWALPDLPGALRRWAALLQPGGRLLLIEGFWHTGGGLHAQQIMEALPKGISHANVIPLSDQEALWGGAVQDERYLIVADAVQ